KIQKHLSPGFIADATASEWSRIYRMPKVLRDGEHSTQNPFFELGHQRALVEVGHVPAMDNSAKSILRRSSVVIENQPTPEEADALLVDRTGVRAIPTPFFSKAKRVLRGRECYPCIFSDTPMAGDGSRNTTIVEYV